MLLAAHHLGLDAAIGQAAPYRIENLAHHLAAVAARLAHGLDQHAVAHRMHVPEGQLLQLAVEIVESEPIGDRRVDLQGLASDATALVRPHGIERAHVVQAVGELDQDHAHIARHGQQHLAEVLRLSLLVGLVLDAVELGDAVHQFGRRLAEMLGELRLGDDRILHDVMEERGDQRLRVEPPAGQRAGDGQRVGNIGFAAGPILAAMRLRRKVVGRLDLGDVLRLEIGRQFRPKSIEIFHQIDGRMHVHRQDRGLFADLARGLRPRRPGQRGTPC